MNSEPKDVIVLGAIKHGIKKWNLNVNLGSTFVFQKYGSESLSSDYIL